jgi:hypothetical protein
LAYQTFRLIQLADSGLPILRFDEDGLECAYGRVRWADVLAVSSEKIRHGISLLFVLRPGTAWEAVEAPYSSYEVGPVERGGATVLRVGLWTSYREATQIVNSYYRPSGSTTSAP